MTTTLAARGRRFAAKALVIAITGFTAELAVHASAQAQMMTDISVAGSAPVQKVISFPKPARGPVVLTLKGKLQWQNTLSKSAGLVTYRWGVLTSDGEFLEKSSEKSLRAQLGPTSSEDIVSVDRSVMFTPEGGTSGSGREQDLRIAIRIDECIFQPPNPSAVATCIFNGTVSLTLPH